MVNIKFSGWLVRNIAIIDIFADLQNSFLTIWKIISYWID